MPERTAAHAAPLALAQQRLDFDVLLRDRVRAMIAAAQDRPSDVDPSLPGADSRDASDEAALLDAQAREFVEQVDRDNDRRQRTAGAAEAPLAYDEAVLLLGERGPVVTSEAEYRATPAYWEAHAGRLDSITTGSKLMAFLRTGE